MPRLVSCDSPLAQCAHDLIAERTTVGRGPLNILRLCDPSVSREHAILFTSGNEVIVRDLGSRNGTAVDRLVLHAAQMQVKHGQTLTFGVVRFRLELDYLALPADGSAVHEHLQYLRRRQS